MIWLIIVIIIVYLIALGYVIPMRLDGYPIGIVIMVFVFFPVLILIQFGGYLYYILMESRFK